MTGKDSAHMLLAHEGVDLSYEVRGSGEPLLLIHGSGVPAAIWGRTIADLAADGHRVIAYDRRGYGASTHSPVRDYRQHVADAVFMLEQVAARPATVVGWSSGANIALALTADHPDLVQRLIVVEPPLHGLRHPTAGTLRMIGRAKWAQLRGKPEKSAEIFFRFVAGDESFQALPEHEQNMIRAHASNILAELDPHPFGAMFEHFPIRRISDIEVPVTFLIGANSDVFFHKVHQRITLAVPSIRTEMIPDAGHLVHIEAPDAFAAAIRIAMSDHRNGRR
ncbi:alpha/beta hydrolase [Nocardia sp. NBC_00565]|uniref:alpha/beta fold hydrolase n=1 Tax=Nocardia sp. NBC_00565 TaxID=2975993 RepID=UPI002E804BD6|nr:alpha/beta hydrolase [Nocardia sp. NBC_00565]WUC03498.1 alpha/beta hydrolase [Nocardia sp. NBC_00565]